MSKNLALFDFDGTLTTKDTLLEFIAYVHGANKMYIGFVLHLPIILLMKLRIVNNQLAKEKILSYFFKGETEEKLTQWGKEFCEQKLPCLLRPEAMLALKKHQENNNEICIVSASADIWIKQFAKEQNIKLICSELDYVNGRFTGKLNGENCNGIVKAEKIKSYIELEKFINIYAYGDSSGDKEMLALSTHPFFRKFS